MNSSGEAVDFLVNWRMMKFILLIFFLINFCRSFFEVTYCQGCHLFRPINRHVVFDINLRFLFQI